MLGGGGPGARPSQFCRPERLGMDGSARHRDLQLALLPGKGMWNPPPVHSRAVFEGMKLDRTFSFPLFGGSGIRERFLLLGLSKSCLQGVMPWHGQLFVPSASPASPYQRRNLLQASGHVC